MYMYGAIILPLHFLCADSQVPEAGEQFECVDKDKEVNLVHIRSVVWEL